MINYTLPVRVTLMLLAERIREIGIYEYRSIGVCVCGEGVFRDGVTSSLLRHYCKLDFKICSRT
jgi:hypothetical protein